MRIALITTAALALAGTAHAGDYKKNDMEAKAQPESRTTVVAKTETGMMVTTSYNQPTVVLGAIERTGETMEFINHVPREIDTVTTDVDVVDEYTYEYRGMTFTNRVVDDYEPGYTG